MAVKSITAAASTVLVKAGGGQFYNAVGIAAGTSYAYTVKDGPDSAGNYQTLFGATAIPVVAGQNLLQDSRVVPFRDGLSVTVSGTPGEFEVHYD